MLSVDEPQKQCSKWNKQDTKDHILYDFTYMKHWE